MADTDYATPFELQERVGANTISDSLAMQYLNTAAYLVDQITRTPPEGEIAFSESGTETRYFDDNIHELGYLRIDDCLSVASITRGGTAVAAAYYKLWPYYKGTGPYTRIMFRGDSVFNSLALFDTSTWYNAPFEGTGVGQIAVTGTWGYCTLANRPPVVKEATLRIATLYYHGLSVSVGDLVQAMGNPHLKELNAIMSMLRDSGLIAAESGAVYFA